MAIFFNSSKVSSDFMNGDELSVCTFNPIIDSDDGVEFIGQSSPEYKAWLLKLEFVLNSTILIAPPNYSCTEYKEVFPIVNGYFLFSDLQSDSD
jgi:hypothetical protein